MKNEPPHAFKKGELDILVATSIVENGIDIPNANTIIVDNADYFGIADLYQLRGRVGRWNRRAFAYFIVKGAGGCDVRFDESHIARHGPFHLTECHCPFSPAPFNKT